MATCQELSDQYFQAVAAGDHELAEQIRAQMMDPEREGGPCPDPQKSGVTFPPPPPPAP